MKRWSLHARSEEQSGCLLVLEQFKEMVLC